MQGSVEDGGEVESLQQLVQPVRTHGGFGSACTFDVCTSRTSGTQEAVGVMGGTGLCTDGECGTGAQAASPETERGGATSVQLGLAATQSVRPSRWTETTGTRMNDGQTGGRAGRHTVDGEARESGQAVQGVLRRAALRVSDALRTTRAALPTRRYEGRGGFLPRYGIGGVGLCETLCASLTSVGLYSVCLSVCNRARNLQIRVFN